MAFKRKKAEVKAEEPVKVKKPVVKEYKCEDKEESKALQMAGAPLIDVSGEPRVCTFAITEAEAKAIMEVR